MKFRIRDTSGWTMFIFGLMALLLGVVALIYPESLLNILGFQVLPRAARTSGDHTLIFLTASAMSSFNIGAYYMLAALNDMKKFYIWTVPFRAVTVTVFTITVVTGLAPVRFLGVAAWELVGAIATGWALNAERKQVR